MDMPMDLVSCIMLGTEASVYYGSKEARVKGFLIPISSTAIPAAAGKCSAIHSSTYRPNPAAHLTAASEER